MIGRDNETTGVLGSRILVVGVGGSQNSCQLHAVVGCAQSPLPKAMVNCLVRGWCVVAKTKRVVGEAKKARYRKTAEARTKDVLTKNQSLVADSLPTLAGVKPSEHVSRNQSSRRNCGHPEGFASPIFSPRICFAPVAILIQDTATVTAVCVRIEV
jgi:hypothetical protein